MSDISHSNIYSDIYYLVKVLTVLSYVIYKVEKNTKVSSLYLLRGKTVPLTENYSFLKSALGSGLPEKGSLTVFEPQTGGSLVTHGDRLEPRLLLQGFTLDAMAPPCCTECVRALILSQPLFSLSFHDWGKYLTRGWLSADSP